MSVPATSAQLREFLGRDRARVRQWDREHWRALLRDAGPSGIFVLGDAMAEDLCAIEPAVRGLAARAADLEHPVALERRIDAACTAFAARARPR
ncbi:MAG: hypothetical protein U0168_32185 [Nannocystaceae bacterium]